MSGRIRASAPGKLMVCGEYAVLEGAEAVVAAAGRRAVAELVPAPGAPVGPEVKATFALAQRRWGAVPRGQTPSIDVSEMKQSGTKLGLGSSAAGAAATAALVAIASGFKPDSPAVLPQLLEVALEGHRAVAPEGSGADVAAAVLGGFVGFRRGDRQGASPQVRALRPPSDLVLRVAWTGKAVRTSDMLREVNRLKAQDRRRYDSCMQRMEDHSTAFIAAMDQGDTPALLRAADQYGRAMEALGDQAGVPIVTKELARIAELARNHSGAAKPSGAGGGDVALAFFRSEASAQAFDAGCVEAGLEVVSVDVGVDGVRLERSQEVTSG